MKAYLLGLTIVYALAAGVVLYLDEAVRINNPWVLSFLLSAAVVPIAASWAGAELIGLVFRRGILDPGRSSATRRAIRGVLAALLGILTALVLISIAEVKWEDWWTMAAASAPWSALFALFGKRARSAHLCGACGYDLRGLTSAAGGRCPECGRHASASALPMRAAA
jgi:hypothetical protein